MKGLAFIASADQNPLTFFNLSKQIMVQGAVLSSSNYTRIKISGKKEELKRGFPFMNTASKSKIPLLIFHCLEINHMDVNYEGNLEI